ncbi:hypothetical protein FKP32DRAFT_1569691 [Trametes sanguinea]|nr:hypothetical protein FKP32DRAFT_1569691 [Trametes sanguinea]
MAEPPAERKCEQCHALKPLAAFRPRIKDTSRGKRGEPAPVCAQCADRKAQSKREKRKLSSASHPAEHTSPSVDLGQLPLSDFLDALSQLAEPYHARCQVDVQQIAPRGPETVKCRAIKVARAVGDVQLLHWTYVNNLSGREGMETLSFLCAQSAQCAKKPKILLTGKKQRDTRRSDRFPCSGWLSIAMRNDSDIAEIRPIKFRAKAVYYYWLVVCQEDWKLDKNPFISAQKLIQERGDQFRLKPMDLVQEPGTESLAFYVEDFVTKWSVHTQELAMDSTWNTNGGNFELFAAVADANSSGIPLAFMFIRTLDGAAAGAKQSMLERFLGALKDLGVKPEFTLSDKDWSEINAMRSVWPEAKHQLCFWHAVRALKQRLCKNKDTPAPYDAIAAKREFTFIEESFVPAAQQQVALPLPPEKPVPRVRLLVGGRPPVLTPAIPKIRLKRKDIQHALRSDLTDPDASGDVLGVHDSSSSTARPSALAPEPVPLLVEASDDELSDDEVHWAREEKAGRELVEECWEDGPDSWTDESDASELDDEDDYRREVEFIERDDGNVHPGKPLLPSESGPKPRSPSYQFCPAAHRLPILRLFAKHACQHSLLPERHGQPRTAELIYRDAVEEMYRHCYTNHLPDVWAYLWNSWYCPARWKLWARSAYGTSIPRKRTTMIVEALWRGIKRLVLHLYNRPPIDLALYAIVTKALPPYRLVLDTLLMDPRAGRAPSLSHTQEDFKHAWERLQKVPIKGRYTTDISRWTCDCGAQKYHSHLLCKHLVQAAGKMPPEWWPTVMRYHVPPFYTIPINGNIAAPPESMRAHAWLKRMQQQPIEARRVPVTEAADDEDSDLEIPTALYGRASSPVLSSSPDKAPPTGADGLLRTRAGGGAGFDLDDEEDVSTAEHEVLLSRAVEILQEQLKNPDPTFIRNAIKKAMRGTIRWVCTLDHRVMPDLESINATDVLPLLERATVLFQEQRTQGDDRFVQDAKQRVRGIIQWVRDIELTESRRTLPRTNVRRRDEPALTNVIGYRYRERADGLSQIKL